MHPLATADLRGTLLCRCQSKQSTSTSGVVAKHTAPDGSRCGFSGMRLKAEAIDRRQQMLSAQPTAARALGIL